MLLLVNIRKNLLWENKNRNYIMALVRSPINKASELRTKENKLRNKGKYNLNLWAINNSSNLLKT